jgi:hypothetical protein
VARVDGKPVMLVLLEWFSGGHSIYRTHSKTLEAARRHFHVVAMGYASNTDELGRAVFDEFITLEQPADLMAACAACARLPGRVGRRCSTCPAWACSPSPCLPPTCAWRRCRWPRWASCDHAFALHRLHQRGGRFRGRPGLLQREAAAPACRWPTLSPVGDSLAVPRLERSDQPVVNVAIAATTMKLNPADVSQPASWICRPSKLAAGTQVRLHFLVGQAQGCCIRSCIG